MQQTNKLIYELEDDDEKVTPKSQQKPKIDRKLGAVSYIKWGTLYNYSFSFDLKRGRLLCYKTTHSNSYNNYYSLVKGGFVEDDQEIKKFESQLQKKKNYLQLEENQNVVYVRAAKGRLFKLVIDPNENYDKIMGYLQMCFQSKIQSVTAFYVLLGVGVVQINNRQFKLTTGVMVSLNDWSKNEHHQNGSYLSSKNTFNLLISNIELLGGIISAFYSIHEYLGIVFNPSQQTVDIILFDKLCIPKQVYFSVFKLVKQSKKKILPSGRCQLLKLKTEIQVLDENGEFLEIAQNDNIKVFCKKQMLSIVDYALMQGSMLSASYIEDQSDVDGDKMIANNALEFYKKQSKTTKELLCEDTKEFIIVQRLEMPEEEIQINSRIKSFQDEQFEDISEEKSGVQLARSINIHMRKSPQKQQEYGQFLSEFSPSQHIKQVIVDIDQVRSAEIPKEELLKQDEIQFQTANFPASSNGNNNGKDIHQEYSNGKSNIIQQSQPDDEEEVDLVKASIVFDSAEHNPCRDYNSIMQQAKLFKKVDRKDEYRVGSAHKKGGTVCLDQKIIDLARSVGRDMISQVGRKLLSGNFNLTTVSFPIRAMIPKSALEKTFMQTILFPLYMNKATISNNPVERLKLSIVSLLSNYIQANSFLKPLNPILGETFEGGYEDGTQLYCEQISHHPPISYFLVYGPKKSYKMFGYSLYEAKAGLNSLTLFNHGKRTIIFDNQKINCTFSSEHYSGTFMGTMKHESQGQLQFIDEINNLQCNVTLGKVKNKPTDYMEGEIKSGKTVISKLFGSYMGFLEFDNVRYWDARDIKPFAMVIHKNQLESDHAKRTDMQSMLSGDMNLAQNEKERLENLQRQDANLRKNYQKQLQSSNKKKK